MCALVVFGGLDPDYTSFFFIGGCNVTLENTLQSELIKYLPQVLIILLLFPVHFANICHVHQLLGLSMGCQSYEDCILGSFGFGRVI